MHLYFCRGFPGFELRYSAKKENISLTISAKFGSVYLAPSQIGIAEPVGGMLSISRGGRSGKDLILAGPIEAINSALQLIQYLRYSCYSLRNIFDISKLL